MVTSQLVSPAPTCYVVRAPALPYKDKDKDKGRPHCQPTSLLVKLWVQFSHIAPPAFFSFWFTRSLDPTCLRRNLGLPTPTQTPLLFLMAWHLLTLWVKVQMFCSTYDILRSLPLEEFFIQILRTHPPKLEKPPTSALLPFLTTWYYILHALWGETM